VGKMKNKKTTRRDFLKKSALAAAGLVSAPHFIPSSVLGRNGISPSNKITIGCVGYGMMGGGNTNSFLNLPDTKVVAMCELDDYFMQQGVEDINSYYENKDCATYHDFRELLLRDDIDVISIAVPDHWHAILSIAAAKAGKDIYGEKPLSHSLSEGRAICDAISRYGRIWQTGSWQRSISNFRFACELVRNGRIGNVHTVEVGLPAGHFDFGGTAGQEAPIEPPDILDYDFWLGPAPYAPYAPARVHKNWRWHLDYGGGQLLDWIGHHCDIAHWGMDLDHTGPVEIFGVGEYPEKGLWNTATRYRVDTKYKNGLKMVIAGGHDDVCGGGTGTKWIGEEGWIHVDRGFIDANPKSLLKEKFGPNDIHLFKSPGHHRNFINCVKSRKQTITPCEVAHRSATPGHLGQISMLLGRKINFNPDTEEIIGDETAARMMSSSYRAPWHI